MTEKLQEHLKGNFIGERIINPPINQQHADQFQGNYPIPESVRKSGLWLPLAAQVSDLQVSCITGSVKKFYNA